MSSLPKNENSLPATVQALGWTSFFTDLSSAAIYPLQCKGRPGAIPPEVFQNRMQSTCYNAIDPPADQS